VVTETKPEPPPATIAVMVVELTIVKEAAANPPKLTEEALLKFVPVIVTIAPGEADVGVKDVMVGDGGGE
jgi:hypothetical protein